ncbi:MAG: metalloregulator ArsR/SmtB family transcription factor [Candidatus Melainabacteria bacterium]|nr:metalloregulator ArsR/SmtB family transcription factor [Candidatus Melainabacteria bacterium]
MPYRAMVSTELAKLFGVLSHRMRIRIIEELRHEDLAVNSLKEMLGSTHAAVSQQLAVLRNSRLVVERREGRNVFYHLRNPELAAWLMDGVKFISPDPDEVKIMMLAIQKTKTAWSDEPTKSKKVKSTSSATKKKTPTQSRKK